MNSHYKLLIVRAAIKHRLQLPEVFLELNSKSPGIHVIIEALIIKHV